MKSDEIPDSVYEAAWNAAFPGLPAGMDTAESVRRVRAAVNVAWPLAVADGRAEAEARGYQRAIDALRAAGATTNFKEWAANVEAAAGQYPLSWEGAAAYLEASARSATPDAEPAPGVPVDTEEQS